MGYTKFVRQLKVALLLIIALWNSGGIGYWVCHGQIQSSCFWLRVCPEDQQPIPYDALMAPPSSEVLQIASSVCDCHFEGINIPVPKAPEVEQGKVWFVNLPRWELVLEIPTSSPWQFTSEPQFHPPDFLCTSLVLRAPPIA